MDKVDVFLMMEVKNILFFFLNINKFWLLLVRFGGLEFMIFLNLVRIVV